MLSNLSNQTVDPFAQLANQLADASRALFAPALGLAPQVQVKSDRTLVTELDRAIEIRMRELIMQRYPSHGILGEEQGSTAIQNEFCWVLDPIDGTAPFVAGVPVFGSLIALLHNGEPILGLMDLPTTQDRWLGVKGAATLHQDKPCQTRACDSLADAMLSTSNPDFFAASELPAFEALRSRTRWRIYGACCMAYGLLTSGRTDIAIDSKLKLWDYAPFIPMIQGAGGRITDWQGRALTLDNCPPQLLAAGDPRRHAEALDLIQKAL